MPRQIHFPQVLGLIRAAHESAPWIALRLRLPQARWPARGSPMASACSRQQADDHLQIIFDPVMDLFEQRLFFGEGFSQVISLGLQTCESDPTFAVAFSDGRAQRFGCDKVLTR